jgi:chloramphenicol-sensitive protein RarD
VPDEINHDERTGIVAGLSAYLLWGLLTLYWKALRDLDPFELIGWRIVCSAALLVVVLSVGRRWTPLLEAARRPRLLGRIALAALLLTANWTCYVWAVVNDQVIETALGYFMAPIGTMLIGVFVLREHMYRAQVIAFALAVAAVAVLTLSYGRVPAIALVLATTWSVYGLLKRQVPLDPFQSLTGETMVVLLPAIGLMAWGFAADDGIAATATSGQTILVLLSGVVTTVPLLLFAVAAPRVPFTILGPLQYVVPTINFLLGWLAFGEELPPSRLVGFLLVWAGLAVLSVDTVRRARTVRTAAVPAPAS